MVKLLQKGLSSEKSLNWMYHKAPDSQEVKGQRVLFSLLKRMHLKLKSWWWDYKIHRTKKFSFDFSRSLNLKPGRCIWLLGLSSVKYALHLVTCQQFFFALTHNALHWTKWKNCSARLLFFRLGKQENQDAISYIFHENDMGYVMQVFQSLSAIYFAKISVGFPSRFNCAN